MDNLRPGGCAPEALVLSPPETDPFARDLVA